jgi:branched-chain amino acid transport system permease protein
MTARLAVLGQALRLAGGLAVGLALVAALLDGAPGDVRSTAVRGLILMVAVIGLYVFMGNSGVVSFGHVAFAAVGAYLGGLVMVNPAVKLLQQPDLPAVLREAELGAVAATLLGGLGGATLALLLVVSIVRLSGLAAGLATFAILVVVRVVIQNWDAVTRGTQGLNNVPSDGVERPLQVLPWVLLALLVAALFQASRSGLRLRASREDEVAARALGIRVRVERGIAFVLSAFLFGVAGALYGQFLGTFGPDTFYLALTFQVISMLIIGGMTSLAGAVTGVVAVTALTDVLRRLEPGIDVGPISTGAIESLSDFGLALATLLVLIARPRGIMGGRELPLPLPLPRWRGAPPAQPATPVAPSSAPAGAARPREPVR